MAGTAGLTEGRLPNVLDARKLLAGAAKDLTPRTIVSCWLKCELILPARHVPTLKETVAALKPPKKPVAAGGDAAAKAEEGDGRRRLRRLGRATSRSFSGGPERVGRREQRPAGSCGRGRSGRAASDCGGCFERTGSCSTTPTR